MDSKLLAAMTDEITAAGLPVHSVLVARNGHLVFEHYFEPYGAEDRHIIYSATKSVTAMLIGAAIDDGLITSDTQPVRELLPDHAGLLLTSGGDAPPLQVKHLVTMTAGFDWQDDPYGVRASGDFSRLLASADGVAYILGKVRTETRGRRWNYNSGASHLLAAIIQEASGMPVLDYARKRLFEPIGIRDAAWSEYQDIANGGSELFLRPRDMARLGHLVLRSGEWDGRQVLPATWVERMTEATLSTVEQLGESYGYGWYTKKLGGRTVRSAEGLGGNGIYVVPELDLVVVFTGGMVGREMLAPYRFIEWNILEAFPSDEGPERITDQWAILGTEGSGEPQADHEATPVGPTIAESVSGKVFHIASDDNLLGITTLGFDFPGTGSGRMKAAYQGTGKDADWGVDLLFRSDDIIEERQEVEVDFGLDGRGRRTLVNHVEVGDIPVLANGSWESGCRLGLEVVTGWAIPQTWTVDFCEANTVSLEIRSIFYDTTVTGHADPS
jgi:CubicO group peptidase (beta-lactamase class C family)